MISEKRIKLLVSVLMAAVCIFSFALSVGAMHISVRVSSSESIMELDAKPQDSVMSLKESIKKMTGVPVEQQTLTKGGYLLPDDRTLEECKIREGDRLELNVEKKTAGDTEASTEPLTPDDVDADGEIIIGSLIINSANIKIATYVTVGILVCAAVIFIYLRKKS